jgi:hypothetical protein
MDQDSTVDIIIRQGWRQTVSLKKKCIFLCFPAFLINIPDANYLTKFNRDRLLQVIEK